MITRENVSNADTTRAFGPEVLTCPDCGHGIDPHGTDPGGPCGVSRCPCLLQPNGIACLLIEARVREARADALTEAADEMEFIITNGDVAEVAAPVEGEVGRASAVSKRDRLYEEPVEWVRLRAEEVRRG